MREIGCLLAGVLLGVWLTLEFLLRKHRTYFPHLPEWRGGE